jgi:hypothetical protein
MALFKPGQSGNPGGKPKGAKNRDRLDIGKIMKDLNFCPFRKLVELAQTSSSTKVQCEATIELCQYVAPKLKSIEITQDQATPMQFNVILNPNTADGN